MEIYGKCRIIENGITVLEKKNQILSYLINSMLANTLGAPFKRYSTDTFSKLYATSYNKDIDRFEYVKLINLTDFYVTAYTEKSAFETDSSSYVKLVGNFGYDIPIDTPIYSIGICDFSSNYVIGTRVLLDKPYYRQNENIQTTIEYDIAISF